MQNMEKLWDSVNRKVWTRIAGRLFFSVLLTSLIKPTCIFGQEIMSCHDRPFWNHVIEVERGGMLILRPLLPYIPHIANEEYLLILNLPDGISLNNIQAGFDVKNRIDSIVEEIRKCPDGRIEVSYRPDLTVARDGLELSFLYSSTVNSGMLTVQYLGYAPAMNFVGTFEWKRFSKNFRVPTSGDVLSPSFFTWGRLHGGDFLCRRVLIEDIETRDVVYDHHPDKPIHMVIEKQKQSHVQLPKTDSLVPGKMYKLICDVKSDHIKSTVMTVEAGLKSHPWYTRTLYFDVKRSLKLPDKLYWRIENGKGQCFRNGTVELIAAKERIAPRRLDTSAWIAETLLPCERDTIQAIYLNALHSWGMNTIEPFLNEVLFGQDLSEEDLRIPMAAEAKELGMKVRAYLRFMYMNDRTFFTIHPEAFPIGPRGTSALGARGSALPCITYLLEGDKEKQIDGGAGNPWLKFYCNVIMQSIRRNKLDGIFFDWELGAAPFATVGAQEGMPTASPRQWFDDVCMCPRCLQAFAKYRRANRTPSREECWNNHYKEWVDFRCEQFIRLWDVFRQIGRDAKRSTTFGMYSSAPPVLFEYSRQHDAVDWKLIASHIDFAMGRWGIPDAESLQKLKRKLLAGVESENLRPKILAQLHVFYHYSNLGWPWGWEWQERLLNLKNNILRLVVQGESFGWSLCGLPGVDSQFAGPLKSAHAILAQFEEYFVAGRQEFDGVKIIKGRAPCVTWKKGADRISFIFNDTGEEQEVEIQDSISGETSRLRLPAHDTVVKRW